MGDWIVSGAEQRGAGNEPNTVDELVEWYQRFPVEDVRAMGRANLLTLQRAEMRMLAIDLALAEMGAKGAVGFSVDGKSKAD